MRYTMQYLKTQNVHLVKDMGMIPYKLHKLYGVNARVATYENGEYPYLKEEVKGLKIDFIKKVFNNFSLDGAFYLIKNGKNIDVLQIFHTTLSSVVYAYTYKLVNPKGKIYLKLDCSHKLIERIKGLNSLSLKLLNCFFNKIDLISVEQKELYPKLMELLPKQLNKIISIPNGVDYDYLDSIGIKYDFSKKENIILNVARIGAEEKNTEMLLEAFASIKNIENSDWKLVLAGPIEENFKPYIEEYFNKYPFLKEKVIFKGNIEDRKDLYREYSRAKIFCLTSDFESVGIAFIEAAAFGDIIVSTDVGIAKELIVEENGKIINVGNKGMLIEALTHFMEKDNLEDISTFTYNLCKEKFDWNNIVGELYKNIVKLIKE